MKFYLKILIVKLQLFFTLNQFIFNNLPIIQNLSNSNNSISFTNNTFPTNSTSLPQINQIKQRYETPSIEAYHNEAKSKFIFARASYCPKSIIIKNYCRLIDEIIKERYRIFFVHSVIEKELQNFQFIIFYSDDRQELILSFSGPKTTDKAFFSKFYSSGWSKFEELNIMLETVYLDVYVKYLRNILFEKLKEFMLSKRDHYRIIFTGHSFGGSIAELSALDLFLSNRIYKTDNSPIVFTYGALTIGDSNFVNKLNQMINVVKIIRSDDYVIQMKNCYFESNSYLFKCLKNNLKKVIRFSEKSMLQNYNYKLNSKRIGQEYKFSNDFLNYHYSSFNSPINNRDISHMIPDKFSPNVHIIYYNINVEECY